MSNEPTKIPALLQRWSEVQPEVCRSTVPFDGYAIGEYSFWHRPDQGGLIAQTNSERGIRSCTGRPAHAWLRDAVEAAIRAEPAIAETASQWQRNRYNGREEFTIWGETHDSSAMAATEAEAMLAAFVAWAEGQGVAAGVT